MLSTDILIGCIDGDGWDCFQLAGELALTVAAPWAKTAMAGAKVAVTTADVAIDVARATERVGDATGAACKTGACKIPGGSCFVAGTLILTAQGERPIEEIEVGDKVWAKDFVTGEDVLRTVDETYVRQVGELFHLTISGSTLTTTREHPFWLDGIGWTEVGHLRAGDVLITPDGKVAIDNIEVEMRAESVYNFRVAVDHNYYAIAGNVPVLVHNADYPPVQMLHPVSSLSKDSVDGLGRLGTDEIVASLAPGARNPLLVKPNGTIMDGNTRVYVPQQRGFDVDSLPRTMHESAVIDGWFD
ncbi:polymorphic toxin-type HINT domain-containing protein [Oerskovia sp. M15]